MGADSLTRPADGLDQWKGRVFVAAVAVCGTAVPVITALLWAVGSLVLARCALLVVLAHRHAR